MSIHSDLNIALISPSGRVHHEQLAKAIHKARSLNINIIKSSPIREGSPSFLNGSYEERFSELIAVEKLDSDAIWCVRGGCGSLNFWHDYHKDYYINNHSPLIGYSDITILHFLRFYHGHRIGIHGPVFIDLSKDNPIMHEALRLLIDKHNINYPLLTALSLNKPHLIEGELIVMNLASLQSIIGCFDPSFLQDKILAIEDVNEDHYKIFKYFHHLKNAGTISEIKAMIIGHLGEERETIIKETIMPLALEYDFPLLDWPIFGHEYPNWPLLFGAKCLIKATHDHKYTLTYINHI